MIQDLILKIIMISKKIQIPESSESEPAQRVLYQLLLFIIYKNTLPKVGLNSIFDSFEHQFHWGECGVCFGAFR